MCLAAGIWLEGVNFAIGSGTAAGGPRSTRSAAATSRAAGLAGYRQPPRGAASCWRTTASCAGAPHLVLSDRVQHALPGPDGCDLVEEMFTVTNPEPKPGAARIAAATRAWPGRNGLSKLRQLATRRARDGARIFG